MTYFKKHIILMAICIFLCSLTNAQFSAVKINTVGYATGNINVAFDFRVGPKTTLNFPLSISPFAFGEYQAKNITVQPGVRYWFYENYFGHFMGAYAIYSKFNIANKKRYSDGWLAGYGFSYGYSFLLTKRWSLELEIGLGMVYADYITKPKGVGIFDDEVIEHHRRTLIVPARESVSFSYLF